MLTVSEEEEEEVSPPLSPRYDGQPAERGRQHSHIASMLSSGWDRRMVTKKCQIMQTRFEREKKEVEEN